MRVGALPCKGVGLFEATVSKVMLVVIRMRLFTMKHTARAKSLPRRMASNRVAPNLAFQSGRWKALWYLSSRRSDISQCLSVEAQHALTLETFYFLVFMTCGRVQN